VAFAEDLSVFLADFGVPCIAGAASFLGILDQPDEIEQLGYAPVQSTDYALMYTTVQATLRRGDAITVNNVAYTVREAPRQQGDGAFSRVLLSKV
jgi:hypothetical protein